MQFERIKNLDTLMLRRENARELVVLLHGYGADFQDLAPIGQHLQFNRPVDWCFPNGPMEAGQGGLTFGRAWFPIDMERLQYALMHGKFPDYFADRVPEGLEKCADNIAELAFHLKESYDVIHLGGFSQGSMVAAYSAFRAEDITDKLMVLSGTFVAETAWRELVKGPLKFQSFQSHGIQDPTLPIAEARRLFEFLKEHNPNHEYHEFSGGHEIPQGILEKLTSFISR